MNYFRPAGVRALVWIVSLGLIAATLANPATAFASTASKTGTSVQPVAVAHGAPAPTTVPASTTTTTVPVIDLKPLLSKVQGDLYQLTAIADFQPAEALVAQARSVLAGAATQVAAAEASLADARFELASSKTVEEAAAAKLRSIAIGAYVGAESPSSSSATSNIHSALIALDAQELLVIVGQRARADYQSAVAYASQSQSRVVAAQRAYGAVVAVSNQAQIHLDSALATLSLVQKAAVSPPSAASPPLPTLTAPGTGTSTPSTTEPLLPHSPVTRPVQVASVSTSSAATSDPPVPVSPSILSAPMLTAAELAAWYASTGHQSNATVPISQLATFYAKWGKTFGVRDDLAFAQSIIETGYFSFPTDGQLTASNNNFAGIGACDSCTKGWAFPDASTGVEAQLELLYQYATKTPLPKGSTDVVGGTPLNGCCDTWVKLAGRWATSPVYGQSIMTVYQSMLSWVIPLREQQAGIATPPPPA